MPLCILALIYFFIKPYETVLDSLWVGADCHEEFVLVCLMGSVTNMHWVEADNYVVNSSCKSCTNIFLVHTLRHAHAHICNMFLFILYLSVY